MAHKSFSDEKNTRKLHFSMSWVNSRCDRMLPSFFHWTLEIHLRLPSINELGSTSQFPNTDVEKLKETQKTAFYLVCSGHRRRVASVLGVATLRLDYSFYTTRYGSISLSSRRWWMPRHISVTAQLQTRKKRKNPKSLPGPSNKTMIPSIGGREQGILQTNIRRRRS